jgi:hypothetical protein
LQNFVLHTLFIFVNLRTPWGTAQTPTHISKNVLSITARQSFGFLFLNPKAFDRDAIDKGGAFFPVIVVFTPKPGLFDGKIPN